MDNREKAIRILEGNYKSFVLRHNGELLTVNELIALLKAQGPRVMTYDELATFDGAFLIESSAISQLDWVFFFDTDTKSDAIWVEGFDGERYVVYREDYGTYTRCWTSRPDEKRRAETPWQISGTV